MTEFLLNDRKIVNVRLPNGAVAHVEARDFGGEERIAAEIPNFEELMTPIEGIASSLSRVWDRVAPQKASVEFGLQVAVEAGKLTSLFVQGSGEANLKICLEWSRPPSSSD